MPIPKKRNYLIDRKYQLRTTFSIISVVGVITILIIGVIGFNVFYNNERINNIYEIENNIVLFLTSLPSIQQDNPYQQAINTHMENHTNNMKTIEQIMTWNKMLLGTILGLVIIMFFLLYFIIIRKTHKISGPVYVMTLYLKDIIEGKMPRIRKLRDGDELVEFHDLFIRMIDKIRPLLK